MFLLNIFGFNFFTLFVTFLVALYFYLTKNFNYWKSHGIDGPKPIVGFGTVYEMFSTPIPEIYIKNAKKFGKIYGEYFGGRPSLVISDPELIKDICIKDFHKFVNRHDWVFSDTLMDNSLTDLKGDDWKNMRSIISPTFSTGKIKRMHPIIEECVERLKTALDKSLEKSHEIDLIKVMGNLTMDVIATCAFGTVIDTHNEEKTSDFIINAKKVFAPSWRALVFFTISPVFPQLLKWTGFTLSDPMVGNFFKSAIQSIVSQRMSDKRQHNDYLQLLLKAKNKVEDKVDDDEVNNEELFGQTTEKLNIKTTADITDEQFLSNMYIFFVAGYETTASLLKYLFYLLAINEECQQKLYEEIQSFNGKKFDYENICKMPYLEACVAETLRLYSPTIFTMRTASEEYTIGNTGIKIPKGMTIDIGITAVHYNPEYYPNPEKFVPERFLPENRNKLTPYTYMPFGIGPRNCVGMRFALIEAKTAIAHLINNYRFFRTDKTNVPLKLLKGGFTLHSEQTTVGIEKRY